MGLETRTLGSSGQCLTNWARQESVGQKISEVSFVCFMHHFTCWTLFISRINRAWLYKGHEDPGWQLNVDLAQLVRHWPEDLEVLVSNPTGGNFWWIFFFAFLCVKICQIIWQKRLSWKTQITQKVDRNAELKKMWMFIKRDDSSVSSMFRYTKLPQVLWHMTHM